MQLTHTVKRSMLVNGGRSAAAHDDGDNPFLYLINGNGSLIARGKEGITSANGSGAVRYRAAEGARTSYFPNPSLGTGSTGWSPSGGTAARVADSEFRSGYCYEATANTSNQGLIATLTNIRDRAVASQTFTVSFSAKLVSGASDWRLQGYGATAAGGFTGGVSVAVNFTATPGITRHVLVMTASADAGQHGFLLYIRTLTAGSVLRIGDLLVEAGTTDGSWFDPVWLDPITGILGTAHASPSVSLAGIQSMDGITNTDNDPVFGNATITNFHAAVGSAVMTRLTTFAGLGSASGEAACTASTSDGMEQLGTTGGAAASGQTWTFNGHIRAKAAGDVGKTVIPIIVERTSADAEVTTQVGSAITLTDAPQEFAFTATLNGGGTTAKVTWRLLNGAASVSTFVLLDKQLANKSHAHPVCFGSAGTGDAWSGTANASTSIRTISRFSTDETGRINPSRGAIWARIMAPNSNTIFGYIFGVGASGASTDYHYIQRRNEPGLKSAWRSGAGSEISVNDGTSAVNTWTTVYDYWNGTSFGISSGGTAATTGTRDAVQGSFAHANDLNIGSLSSGSAFCGAIRDFCIFSREPTARELAILANSRKAHWNMLRDAA